VKQRRCDEPLTGEDADLIRVVADDLEYMAAERIEPASRAEARMLSTSLRRLLVYSDYQRAWKAAGLVGQPRVRGRDMAPMWAKIEDPSKIQYGFAGGSPNGGVGHNGLLIWVGAALPIEQQESVEREFTLQKYLEGTCIVIATNQVSRRELLKYVAHKMGGAHLDAKRGHDRDKKMAALLDDQHHHYYIGGLSGPYYEVLCMAHDLGRSSDAHRFVAEARRLMPERPNEKTTIRFREGFGGPWNEMRINPDPPAESAS
jgi:hypothetical protein